ncbi:MAG TPA: nucleotidyltransferase domain-containing protein [Gemmatimonadaceae bacterium]|nr:nucleotidyltransferase domain-containing protein [Gemmatimonadaceae bacterium]
MLTPGEVDEVVRRIVARMDPERVIVYGSYAKGTATARSDLDLLVVLETDLPMRKRARDVRAMFADALVPVDVHVYTPEEVEEYGREPLGFIRCVLSTGREAYRRLRREVA